MRPGRGMTCWQATGVFGPRAWTFAPAPGRGREYFTHYSVLKVRRPTRGWTVQACGQWAMTPLVAAGQSPTYSCNPFNVLLDLPNA